MGMAAFCAAAVPTFTQYMEIGLRLAPDAPRLGSGVAWRHSPRPRNFSSNRPL